MGLFDKLIKEGINAVNAGKDAGNEVATEENKEKARELFGKIKETVADEVETLKKAAEDYREKQQKEETVTSDSYEPVNDGKTARQRILDILEEEFPQYHVTTDGSPVTLGGKGRFMDYSIVISNEEQIALIIMMIGKTTTAHREYRWSREFAEERGIKVINFINHYPNRPEYIIERLHRYL